MHATRVETTTVACAGVSVTLGSTRALDDVTLAVVAGEWLAIVGPNGAGKSTLLRVVAGLLAPDGGRVELDGRDVADLRRRDRAQRVALVPQAPVVPPGMTVTDYVLLGRTPHLRPLAAEGPADLAATHDAMVQFDLLPFADRELASLSGGERQRVFLARAFAQGAPVLLLDEPTTALDVGHQQQVLELVDDLRRDHALTVVTTLHDLTLAGQYADRLVLLDAGRVVAAGSAADVLTETNLTRYYGASVRIIDDAGRPLVVPLRPDKDRVT
jgi:iron complex transport system ATP-binding protein